MREALELAGRGTEAIYVSLDIDALDKSIALGTSAVSIGAFNVVEILEAVYLLGKNDLMKALDF